MQLTLLISSLSQLQRWIEVRKQEGYVSAHCYLAASRKLQLEVEEYLHEIGYRTIFMFGQRLSSGFATGAYILW